MFNWYYVAGHIKKSVADAAFHVYNTSGSFAGPANEGSVCGRPVGRQLTAKNRPANSPVHYRHSRQPYIIKLYQTFIPFCSR